MDGKTLTKYLRRDRRATQGYGYAFHPQRVGNAGRQLTMREADYSSFTPADFTTAVHFGISLLM